MKASPPPVLPTALKRFLGEYLPQQRAYSPHTILSYRDSLKLLLQFAAGQKRSVADLTVADLSPATIAAFLQHLEARRHNGITTRNVRLAAIHSFFHFLGAEYPEHLEQTHRILSVPFKRATHRSVEYLEAEELRAVLSGIDQRTAAGRRDYVLLLLLFNTGARVQEIVTLKTTDLHLTAPPSVKLLGKGRKERLCPLWPETVRLLRQHLAETVSDLQEPQSLFRNHRDGVLTRFGVRCILQRHVQRAAQTQPSLQRKRIHPHSIRHSTAVHLLKSGVDLSTIAHWLGHADVTSANKYVTIDMQTKREVLRKAGPILAASSRRPRWRRDQELLHWLESL